MEWNLVSLEKQELKKLAAVYEELGMSKELKEVSSLLKVDLFSEAAREPSDNPEVEDALSTAEAILAEYAKFRQDTDMVARDSLSKLERAFKTSELSDTDRNTLAGFHQKLSGMINSLGL